MVLSADASRVRRTVYPCIAPMMVNRWIARPDTTSMMITPIGYVGRVQVSPKSRCAMTMYGGVHMTPQNWPSSSLGNLEIFVDEFMCS